MSFSPIADLLPSNDNKEMNKYTCISTYNMGKIGIKKIVDDTFKTQLNSDNKLIQSYPINNFSNITNSNTNNTNTNTNSNTNNNTSKNRNLQASKKKLKNIHSVSPNIVHNHTQYASNANYYKNKINQRINIVKKNNSKPPISKLNKKDFSKSVKNFYVHPNINLYNKSKYHNKSYSTKKNVSNSKNKLLKERKITDGQLKSHSYHSSCIFSSMSPNSIKREKKKYSKSNLIINNKNENNNSLKRDESELYIKNNNLSSTDINPNTRKLVLKEENNRDNNIDFEQKYQMTEANTNYLRVKIRPDFQIHFKNINTPKVDSTPALRDEITKSNIFSQPSSCMFNDIDNDKSDRNEKNEGNKDIGNLTEKNKNNIFLHSDSSNEEIIPKLNLKDADNYLYHDKIKEKEIIKNSYDKGYFNINISSSYNKKKEIEIKNMKNIKERENNFVKNKNLKNYYSRKKDYNNNNNKNYSSNKNKSQNKIKKIEFNKSNTNDNAFIKYKPKYNNYNNITSLKDAKTEENISNLNISKNARNNKKFSGSCSKNKYNNKTRKNYSLNSNNKTNISSKESNNSVYMQSNRNKSYGNNNYKNRMIDLNNKLNENKTLKENKKEDIDFDCPEEMHYFMVKLSINYKYLTENF